MLHLLLAELAVAAPCHRPPVDGPIVEPFRAPPCDYCPGHRGVEFASEPTEPVHAVAAGEVSFVGAVAGVRYVVITHEDGLRATYGQMRTTAVRIGEPVVEGAVVGTAGDRVYFGLRRGTTYIDPTPLFGTWRYRPRLVPTDGTVAPPAGPPRLVCRNPPGWR